MNARYSRQHAIVGHPGGLRLHPLISVWTAACTYQSDLRLHYADRLANAKLLLDLVQLSAPPESLLVIEGTGSDAVEAVNHIRYLIETDLITLATEPRLFDPERHPIPQAAD
jgi:phosphotransferase system HPr-like phosphotransfer protein